MASPEPLPSIQPQPLPPRRKTILAAGLGRFLKHPPGFVSPFGTPEEIQRKVDDDLAKCRDAGFECVHFELNPEDLARSMDSFKRQLRGRDWDAVLIGFGVRGTPAHTPLFEAAVNMCRVVVPNTPMMFSAGPDKCLEACCRIFPDA
jgi:hypothetical protein